MSCPHFPYISFYRGLDNLRRLHLRKFRGATHVPVPHPLAYDRLIIAVAKLHGPAVSSQLRSHQPRSVRTVHSVVWPCQRHLICLVRHEHFLCHQRRFPAVLGHSGHLECLQARLADADCLKAFGVIATLPHEAPSPSTVFDSAPIDWLNLIHRVCYIFYQLGFFYHYSVEEDQITMIRWGLLMSGLWVLRRQDRQCGVLTNLQKSWPSLGSHSHPSRCMSPSYCDQSLILAHPQQAEPA